MDSFTPEQLSIILQIVVMAAGTGSALVGGLSYMWKRRGDAKLEEQKQKTVKAQADADEAKTNAANLGRLIEIMGQRETAQNESRAASIEAMRALKTELETLSAIDTQRIKQNDVIAANIQGARDDIRKLATDFDAGKNDTVQRVGLAMDEKLKPIEDRLKDIQRQISDTLALLRAMESDRQPAPPVVVEKPNEDEGDAA